MYVCQGVGRGTKDSLEGRVSEYKTTCSLPAKMTCAVQSRAYSALLILPLKAPSSLCPSPTASYPLRTLPAKPSLSCPLNIVALTTLPEPPFFSSFFCFASSFVIFPTLSSPGLSQFYIFCLFFVFVLIITGGKYIKK